MTYADLYQISSVGTAREVEGSRICSILNLAQELIWRSFPWRWTLAEFDPFWIVPGEQDYGSPLIIIPTDFLELQSSTLVHLNHNTSARYDFQLQKNLTKTHRYGHPKQMQYIPQKNAFRIYPRPPLSMACPYYLIEGWYKKTPTILTPSNYANTTVPSQEFQRQMWLEAISWAYLATAKSPQAPQQLQIARLAINETAQAESTSLGQPNIHPSESIVSDHGLFGLGPGITIL